MKLIIVIALLASVADAISPSSLSFISTPSSLRTRNQDVFRKLRGGASSTQLYYNSTGTDAGSTQFAELWEVLETSIDGLTTEEAQNRAKQYGKNKLDPPKGKSLLSLICEQFEDRLVQILLGVAVLSGIFSYLEVRQSVGDDALWKSFVEPFVILAILILNAAVGVWQTSSAQGSLDALQKMQPAVATVLRDGSWQAGVDASELVPGDILEIRVGDKIPADVRLVQLLTSSMQIDEGSLTGESVTVPKIPGDEGTVYPNMPVQDQRGMLYSGTMVTSGTGRALVVQTGMDTQMGKIQKGVTQAKEDQPKTPLAIKLDEFGNTLTKIIGVICLAVWVISIPKMDDASFSNFWDGAVYYAKVSVALGVAAIPEGLPAVITLCLSLGTRRMAQRNVIVRKLPSVETLGCTSVICTDKTGTLTTNEMTAVSLVLVERKDRGRVTEVEHTIEGVSYAPAGKIASISRDEEILSTPKGAVADCAAVAALCNDASIVGVDSDFDVYEEDIVDEHGGVVGKQQIAKKKKKLFGKKSLDVAKAFERVGEPTEAALCVLAEKLGGCAHFLEGQHVDSRTGLHLNVPPSVLASANVNEWRSKHPRKATLEFNRDRKSMSVLCDFNGNNKLLVKGAPNLLIERCTKVKLRDGSTVPLSGELRRNINDRISALAKRPLRCLALAVKDGGLEKSLKSFEPRDETSALKHPLLGKPKKYKDIESGLTLVGIVGIKDPARPEVAESINECTKAGIRVMMITGDAKDTAVAIARDVNIFPSRRIDEHLKAYEGREFFLKPEAEQLELLKKDNIVFCRAEPADKQKLVKMLQSLGEIPAMTGDGVNDAAALQQSAIGIAMGITGTEVAKEAADMVLADDNFSTIVAAVEEGRRIYANMQAFICFLISCNIGEICAILIATIGGFPEPLTAMHLLWVNLVTDGPPATALGFNPPSPDLMDQNPRPSNEPIMTRWLLTRYCLTGLYVGIATVGVFAGHYMSVGVSLPELANWSKCGDTWTPTGGAQMCEVLFNDDNGRLLPQTLSLTTLVVMEMLKALSAVSVDSSLLTVGPFANPWLILGVAFPFALHLGVVYSAELGFPALAESFGLVALTKDDWWTVLYWAAPILILDEVLKLIGRILIVKRKKREIKALL